MGEFLQSSQVVSTMVQGRDGLVTLIIVHSTYEKLARRVNLPKKLKSFI